MKKIKKIDLLLFAIFISVIIYFIISKVNLKGDDNKTIYSKRLSSLNILPDTLIDLGILKSNIKNEVHFIIKNSGNEKLFIRDFTTTCGCTSISTNKNDININDSCQLNATIDTEGKFGKNVSVLRFKANTKSKFHRIYLKYKIG